jgi:hypothetical protein
MIPLAEAAHKPIEERQTVMDEDDRSPLRPASGCPEEGERRL